MLRFLFRLLICAALLVIFVLIALRIAAYVRESLTEGSLVPPMKQCSWPADADCAYINTPDTRFYTLPDGPIAGRPVLIAHGTAASSLFWEKEVRLIAQAGYRAVAFDMPPFGWSSRAQNGDYSRQTQASRILALARTQPQPPIMVAHSFGAAAATEAVLRNPEAFSGLIIVDGAIGLGSAPSAKVPLPLRPMFVRELALSATATNPMATRFLLKQLIYQKDAATDDIVEVLQKPQRRLGTTAAYADWLPSLLAPDPSSLTFDPANYANLPIPVRIIWGDQDTVTPPEQAEALADAFGQSEVLYLRDVGHIPHIEAPEAFAELLLKQLAEITQAR